MLLCAANPPAPTEFKKRDKMGYSINVHVQPPAGYREGVAEADARALAAHQVQARQLPTECPECGSDWAIGSTTAVGSSGEDWTFRYRCPNGHES